MSTKINKTLLISEIECRPVLWQDNNRDYKNKRITDVQWREVALSCNTSVSEVKSKWKNLKDQYRKELQKKPSMKQLNPKWMYFDDLSFLRDHISSNQKESNINTNQIEDVKDSFDIELDMKTHAKSIDAVPQDGRSESAATSSMSYTSIKRRRPDMQAEFLMLEEERLDHMKEEMRREIEDNNDSDLLFFRSLLPHLNSFNDTEKFELKINIMQLILKAKKKKEHQSEGFNLDLSQY